MVDEDSFSFSSVVDVQHAALMLILRVQGLGRPRQVGILQLLESHTSPKRNQHTPEQFRMLHSHTVVSAETAGISVLCQGATCV